MSPLSPLGRPSDRKNLVVAHLRHQIIEGHLLPGDQLPTRVELEQQFLVSTGTVQSALEELRRDGFVEVRGRQGTFVSAAPPHLTNYALVFPHLPETNERHGIRFWTALANEAAALQRIHGTRITSYYGLELREESEDFRRLTAEVKAQRLAGIVFASQTVPLTGTAILEEPGIARVAIASGGHGNMSFVRPDVESFWDRAFGLLAAKGRQRPAVLMPPPLPHSTYLDTLLKKAAQYGFDIPAHHTQSMCLLHPESAFNLMLLMFREGQPDRPDSLIIADDNLVQHASAGLVAAGIRAPEQVEVIAHCNFPWPAPHTLPVTLLGFDARRVLLECLAILDERRQKGTEFRNVSVPACFEAEIEAARLDRGARESAIY